MVSFRSVLPTFDRMSTCNRCHCVVLTLDELAHQDYHDELDDFLAIIMAQAKRHVPEQTYGGR